ncbi:MAG: hypothetical protein AB1Z98_13310 [Nannocystaceae bacterium]
MLERGYEERTIPRTSPLRLAVLVVLMAATVLAANWGVGRFLDRRGTNLGYVYIAHKWRVLGRLRAPVDWLVLGDSSGSQGFDPAVLQEQTGKTAVNLGTIGNFGLSDDLWMLEEYIERFGPPQRVVLIHVYDVWYRRLKPDLVGRIPRPWVLTDETAERYDFDEEMRRDIFLNRYVRLFAERTSLRKSIQYAWLRLVSDEDELAELRRKDRALPPEDPELLDSGFVRMCGSATSALKRDARGHMRFVKKRRPRISKDNREALLEIARLAQEHGFEVHVVNGPVYERLRIKPEFGKYFDRQVQLLEKVVEDYPQVHIAPETMGFDGDQLQNVDHISCEATGDYTRWAIAQVLAQAN